LSTNPLQEILLEAVGFLLPALWRDFMRHFIFGHYVLFMCFPDIEDPVICNGTSRPTKFKERFRSFALASTTAFRLIKVILLELTESPGGRSRF
jgi:hypothetical protein